MEGGVNGVVEEEDAAEAIESEIQDLLEEEFPPEEHEWDKDDGESEEAASARLSSKIEEHFLADESAVAEVTVRRSFRRTRLQTQSRLRVAVTLTRIYSGPFCLQELLAQQNIPQVTLSVSRKLPTVQHQLLQRVQPLLTHRESLFQRCRPVSHALARRLLRSAYMRHSAFGCWDPVKVSMGEDLYQHQQTVLGVP